MASEYGEEGRDWVEGLDEEAERRLSLALALAVCTACIVEGEGGMNRGTGTEYKVRENGGSRGWRRARQKESRQRRQKWGSQEPYKELRAYL